MWPLFSRPKAKLCSMRVPAFRLCSMMCFALSPAVGAITWLGKGISCIVACVALVMYVMYVLHMKTRIYPLCT